MTHLKCQHCGFCAIIGLAQYQKAYDAWDFFFKPWPYVCHGNWMKVVDWHD